MRADNGPEFGGLVLAVDDEEHVLRFTARMLTQLGFDVITARDGAEAVDEFRRHGTELVLVVLDLTLPGRAGGDVLSELEREPVAVPIVVSSGFATEELVERFAGRRVAGYLQKPYRLEELRETLHGALTGR